MPGDTIRSWGCGQSMPSASWHPLKASPDLFTKNRYCDYVIELDCKMAAKQKSNSGVFLRVHDPRQRLDASMEVQILDNADYGVSFSDMHANGALYELMHPTVDANVPLGNWNHYRITANDNRIVVELNGKEVVKADLNQWTTAHKNPDGSPNKYPHAFAALPREGFIGLQNYGGTQVWFRNIRVKPLSNRQPQYMGKEPVTDTLRKLSVK